MSAAIPWSEYAPEQVETLVAAWLVRVVPGAQRVDGAGGDDGVDVRAPERDGIHVFEIKSFHRRLGGAQKKQIQSSLETALARQPKMLGWTLVLPLDLTPAENRWFDETLAPSARIPVQWIGRTQIESGLSLHRDLLRTLAPGSAERRALDLVAQYRPVPAVPVEPPAQFRVGAGDGGMAAEFDAALTAAGGTPALGAPLGDVVREGPGYVQPFSGAVVVCALPERAAAVVPATVWQQISRIGGPENGISAVGFPVARPARQQPLIIDAAARRIELDGGEWGPGFLTRASQDEPWSWDPVPRLDFRLSHNTRWTGPDWADLRVRAVVSLPWRMSSIEPEISKARRLALQNALADSEFSTVFPVLSMHRGARLAQPTWEVARGNDTYQSDRGTHLRALLRAPDGSNALSGEVMVQLPDGMHLSSVVGGVELRINFAVWRDALVHAGAVLDPATQLRLSLLEVLEILASAWGTAATVIPRAAADDPSRMPLARPPWVEMHLQSRSPIVIGGAATNLGLTDVIDLSALGEPTREGHRQETGMRFFAPLSIARPDRRIWLARGLAQLGRSWGYVDAEADDLLAGAAGTGHFGGYSGKTSSVSIP
ncbi:hypothetical protein [Actinoplanes sp. NPDC049118]|uniref:hypothetical protein n=1 Tax=Actinoplanes sp. NPDC049118 TaxID=3155769 RepID=UPI0033F2DB0D